MLGIPRLSQTFGQCSMRDSLLLRSVYSERFPFSSSSSQETHSSELQCRTWALCVDSWLSIWLSFSGAPKWSPWALGTGPGSQDRGPLGVIHLLYSRVSLYKFSFWVAYLPRISLNKVPCVLMKFRSSVSVYNVSELVLSRLYFDCTSMYRPLRGLFTSLLYVSLALTSDHESISSRAIVTGPWSLVQQGYMTVRSVLTTMNVFLGSQASVPCN